MSVGGEGKKGSDANDNCDVGAWKDYFEPRWYAAYTWARHEKNVAHHFEQRSIQHFLPTYKTIHRWKNGKAHLELPLFPSYIFVRIPLKERIRPLQVPGVVRLVEFNGSPAPLPDLEIQSLIDLSAQGLKAEPYAYLTVGKRVRIRAGPLQGLEGILVRKKSSLRVVVSVDLIMRSIVVDVDASDLETVPEDRSVNSSRPSPAHVITSYSTKVSGFI
ncbi:MAG TPA: UpxY family transcription antiterminator [Terriglobales bacterium]|nr:UpxY family transcription antiterminator [Terriglobales bacterium]